MLVGYHHRDDTINPIGNAKIARIVEQTTYLSNTTMANSIPHFDDDVIYLLVSKPYIFSGLKMDQTMIHVNAYHIVHVNSYFKSYRLIEKQE